MNGPAEYRYDVFVSYRHKDLDRGWAKWLVESLAADVRTRADEVPKLQKQQALLRIVVHG